jgi:hypothetical protein
MCKEESRPKVRSSISDIAIISMHIRFVEAAILIGEWCDMWSVGWLWLVNLQNTLVWLADRKSRGTRANICNSEHYYNFTNVDSFWNFDGFPLSLWRCQCHLIKFQDTVMKLRIQHILNKWNIRCNFRRYIMSWTTTIHWFVGRICSWKFRTHASTLSRTISLIVLGYHLFKNNIFKSHAPPCRSLCTLISRHVT